MHELILYATPNGPLAEACSAYFASVEPTSAQRYPPHVTLTGFFRRGRVTPAVEAASGIGPVPNAAVTVKRLRCTDDWVGLEVGSPWLETAAAAFAERVPAGPTEDDIRIKDWLHLSLAYGVSDVAEHAARARAEVDATLAVTWEVALWERVGGTRWERLT